MLKSDVARTVREGNELERGMANAERLSHAMSGHWSLEKSVLLVVRKLKSLPYTEH